MPNGSLYDHLHSDFFSKLRKSKKTLEEQEKEKQKEDKKKQQGYKNTLRDPVVVLKILQDVARGMVFLHSFNPPILHRGQYCFMCPPIQTDNLFLVRFEVPELAVRSSLEHQSCRLVNPSSVITYFHC